MLGRLTNTHGTRVWSSHLGKVRLRGDCGERRTRRAIARAKCSRKISQTGFQRAPELSEGLEFYEVGSKSSLER
jgi:hypothetical protein